MRVLALLLLAASLAAQQPRSNPPYVSTTSSTGPHSAVLNYSNASCTSIAVCNIQVYRAQCSSATNCPTYSAGSSSWKALDMNSNLNVTPGVNGTVWVYTDKDPALQDSTTYSWVATNTYSGGTTSSPGSTAYNGTTNNGTPPAPTLNSSGNSVQ